ncbi:arylsulfatase [Hymenobacter sp. GOD-10R]|uniref:sulfatase family protein n=1 Tax=Hymenobacter sp. GOD-10R TaxID=3093922 RepID=UPI002D7714FA|nr:arylsulfatase [Hymenobacter sp. GOD-10R]WRQ27984.1 arylsulfatase [Hymenobacter sp. GOD-10R]
MATTSCQQRTTHETAATTKPNVLIIYADDLGYGDVSANNQGKIATLNIDKLAASGVRFTNGYATSATCTPSRFALLTGTYPWRNKNAQILPGDAPLLIDTASMTMADMFRQQGYATGVVGKWHLGLGRGHVDWNQPIMETPNDLGFDYSYIMAATADRVPTVYVENRRVAGLQANDPLYVSYEKNFPSQPTALTNPELMTKMKWHHGHNQSVHNGIPRIGYMKGGKAALWDDASIAAVFLEKAKAFVDAHQKQPFFLYYALHEPHVPRVPGARFAGKSGLGPRGDAVLEADWCVGEIMRKLQEDGLADNTLVVFSSDNGPVLNDGYYDEAVEKNGAHTPWGQFRGGKYSLLEAGTRVPFIVNWPGHVQQGTSNAVVSQVDLLASLAALVHSSTQALDSQNLLATFLGKSTKGRANLVLEASGRLAFRSGDWLLIPPYRGKPLNEEVNLETGLSPTPQLYNLASDLGQRTNLASIQPAKLTELQQQFKQVVGPDFQANTEELQLH